MSSYDRKGRAPKGKAQKKKRDLSAKGSVQITGIGSASGSMSYKRAPLASARRQVTRKPLMNGSKAFRVVHSEYLGDLTAVAPDFRVSSYAINPGLSGTFPWLSSLAKNFDQYSICALRVRFESSAPATEFGRVFLAFDYDPQDAPPETKGAFMSYKGACSDAVWTSSSIVMSGPRVGRPFFTRTAQVVGDVRLYDAANVLVSTSGVSNGVVCGELYLDYEISLINPQGNSPCGSVEVYLAATLSTGAPATGTTPLTGATSSNPQGVSVDDGSHFSIHAPGNYIVSISWINTAGIVGSGSYFNCSVISGSATSASQSYGWNTVVAGMTQIFILEQTSVDAQYNLTNALGSSVSGRIIVEVTPASK